jgi:peroxiredoxin
MGTLPKIGQAAQEFELLDSTRTPRRLSDLVAHGRLVLVFYRGSW